LKRRRWCRRQQPCENVRSTRVEESRRSPIIYPEQRSDKGSHPSEFLAAAIAWAADEAERDGSLPEIRRSLESSLETAEGETYNTLLRAELVRRESNASEASPNE